MKAFNARPPPHQLLGCVSVILCINILYFGMGHYISSSLNLARPPDTMFISQAANSNEILQRFTKDSFKSLNKRLDSMQSHLGSLSDKFSMLKMQQSTDLDTTITHGQHKCDFGTQVKGNWEVSNSGTWEWTNGFCKAYVIPDRRVSCLLRFPKYVFLGDSQMYHLFLVIIRSLSTFSCVSVRTGARCGNLGNYYRIQELQHAEYQKPNFSKLEGPLVYGLSNPGCSDCGGCDAALFTCQSKAGETISLEYLPMEFIKDVELQSVLARTSQENIMHYLAQSDSVNNSIFVLNSGLHDLLVVDLLAGARQGEYEKLESLTEKELFSLLSTADIYESNVKWLASLFKQYNVSSVTFLATSAIKQPRPNTNMLIKTFNQHAFSAMVSTGHSYLDTFSLLDSQKTQSLFSDVVHVHHGGSIYYETVRDLLLRSVCPDIT